MYYVAYGSNLNLEQMAHRCPTAKVVGSAILKDYRLLFRGWPSHSVATIEKRKIGVVPVLVWDIQSADEKALDRYEGYPDFYHKEMLPVCIDEERLDTMVYIMNGGRPLGAPNKAYFAIILQGYLSAGFDLSILNSAARVSIGKRLG